MTDRLSFGTRTGATDEQFETLSAQGKELASTKAAELTGNRDGRPAVPGTRAFWNAVFQKSDAFGFASSQSAVVAVGGLIGVLVSGSEATIDANREMQVALKGSDFKEGVASFMEKRPPRFTGE